MRIKTTATFTNAYPDQAVLGLELLGSIHVVIDQSEAGALAATEGSAETYLGQKPSVRDILYLLKTACEISHRVI